MRRVTVGLAVLVAALVLQAPRAWAGYAAGGFDNPTNGTVGASAGYSQGAPTGGPVVGYVPVSSSGTDPCQFQWISGTDLAGPGGDTNGTWALWTGGPASCVAGWPPSTLGAFTAYWFPAGPGGGAAPALPPQALAQQALSSAGIVNPSFQTWPPSGRGEVNFPTWIHVSSDWAAVTTSATAGAETVRVTATPSAMTVSSVDSSDGGASYHPTSISCPGPGSAYDTNESYSAQHSDCSVTWSWPSANYASSSSYGTYPLTVAVTYQVTWTAVGGAGGGGALAPITRSATADYPVGEIEALGS